MTDELKYRAVRALKYTLKDLNNWKLAASSAITCEALGAKWSNLASGCSSSTEALTQLHSACRYANRVGVALSILGRFQPSPDDLVGDIIAYLAVLRDSPAEEEKLRTARILRHTYWVLDSMRGQILVDVGKEAHGEPWQNEHFRSSPLAVSFYAQTDPIVAEAKAACNPYHSALYEPSCERLLRDIDHYLPAVTLGQY